MSNLFGMLCTKGLEMRNDCVNSVWQGTESVSYLGPKIWDLIPNEIKESDSLNGFKFKIKRWVPEGCPCRICKIYLGQVGFIVT